MIRSRQQKYLEIFAYGVMILVAIVILYPFLLLFMSSLTDEITLTLNGYSVFPKKFSLRAYEYIWDARSTIFRAYGVTIGVTLVGTLGNVFISALAAYPLSLRKLPGKNLISFIFLFTMLFNGGMVSTYMTYTTILHIKNTYAALLVPGLLFSPVNCIIIRTYFRTNVPEDLYDAAKIDGASEWKTFFHVAVPMSVPIFVTIGIFAGLAYWNDWFNGMLYVTDRSKFSIQQVLNIMISNIQYLSQFGGTGKFVYGDVPSVSVRMAIAFVAFLPILLLYPFLQKYFRSGIALGAVKG